LNNYLFLIYIEIYKKMSSLVQYIKTEEELNNLVNKGLTVIDFSAKWCGPCKMIEPHYNALSVANPTVTFTKVDIDELPDLANKYDITAVPTFLFVEGNNILGKVAGANLVSLKSVLANLTSF
jgi:thioredoxin 1